VLPSRRHRAVGKESGQTNHIEWFNYQGKRKKNVAMRC